MAYLAVNKDGTELICSNEPDRWGNITRETTSPLGKLDKNTGKRYYTKPAENWEIKDLKFEELSYWKDEEVWGGGEYRPEFSIELPKGSIKKLIGKDLTWDDDPVEI